MALGDRYKVVGWFTLEKNIVNRQLEEIETALGLPHGLLLRKGARILLLNRRPSVGEFAFGGSTLYPDGQGLVALDERQNVPVPHAWLGQRLAKVMPVGPRLPDDKYPRVTQGQVEQWLLMVKVDATEVSELQPRQPGQPGRTYWPKR